MLVAETVRRRPDSGTVKNALQVLLLTAAAIFFAFPFRFISQQTFPNNSPWMDWAKYTDEGWYGDAAIRHFQLGRWYVPKVTSTRPRRCPSGRFLRRLVFRFTGVGIVPARALTPSPSSA